MSEFEGHGVKSWQDEARNLQQRMFQLLGDREWVKWPKGNLQILRDYIGYALYSLPKDLPLRKDPTEYNPEQLNTIEALANTILAHAGNVKYLHFACIFGFEVRQNKLLSVPVFKIKKRKEKIFVDSKCKVYYNWETYLRENGLSGGIYCYPKDGIYQGCDGQVLVNFFDTKEEGSDSTDFNSDDLQIDLNNLQEEVNLFGIAGLAFGITEKIMRDYIKQEIRTGNLIPKSMSIIHDIVQLGSITVNGLEILGSFLLLLDKKAKGTLDDTDLTNFSSSLLFFLNCISDIETVKEIIDSTQKETLEKHCEGLTEPELEVYVKLCGLVEGETPQHKKAKTIEAVNHIRDKKSFYSSLVTVGVSNDHQVRFSFEELGLVNINNELNIAPNKLVEISENDRNIILDATKRLKDSSAASSSADPNREDPYWKSVEKVLLNNRLYMQYQRKKVKEMVQKKYGKDNLDTVEIGGAKIFENMLPSELDRFADLLKKFNYDYNSPIFEIADEFAKRVECKTPRDYFNFVEFVSKYVSDLKTGKERVYRRELSVEKKKESFDLNAFQSARGIEGKLKTCCLNQVFNDFDKNPEESFKALVQQFTDLQLLVSPLNANMDPNFAADSSAVYHYYKHSEFSHKKLTPDEYFDLASKLVNEPVNQSSNQLTQQGNKRIITFADSTNGAKGVVFETLEDGKRSLATVYYDAKSLKQF